MSDKLLWNDDRLHAAYKEAFNKDPDVHHWALLSWVRDELEQERATLTAKVEELAAGFQASYDADLDLMTRRDTAQTARIAELERENANLAEATLYFVREIEKSEAQEKNWESSVADLTRLSLEYVDEIAELEARLADANLHLHDERRYVAELEAQLADARKEAQELDAQLAEMREKGHWPVPPVVGGVIYAEWDTSAEDEAWKHLEDDSRKERTDE